MLIRIASLNNIHAKLKNNTRIQLIFFKEIGFLCFFFEIHGD